MSDLKKYIGERKIKDNKFAEGYEGDINNLRTESYSVMHEKLRG